MRKLTVLVLASVLGTLAACAGSSSSGGSKLKIYTSDLGIASTLGVRDQTQRLLVNKYHYILQYFDESADRIYVETEWKDREPFGDEKTLGVVQARSRIILEARARARAGTTANLLRVKFRGENMLLLQDSGEWVQGAHMTKQAREHFKKIADDIKTQFSTTPRVFNPIN